MFVYVEGQRRAADTFLSSAGDVCGHHVHLPDNVVTTTFTGTATIEESGKHRLEGREAFLEIRLAAGRAGLRVRHDVTALAPPGGHGTERSRALCRVASPHGQGRHEAQGAEAPAEGGDPSGQPSPGPRAPLPRRPPVRHRIRTAARHRLGDRHGHLAVVVVIGIIGLIALN